jgi:hypothetical protein
LHVLRGCQFNEVLGVAAAAFRYHPECLKTSSKALKSQSNWRCPDCVKRFGVLTPPVGTAAAPAVITATRSRDDDGGDAAQKGSQQKRRKTAAE